MKGEEDKWQKCDEDVALNVPLIADHERNQISGSCSNNNVTTASFLKTCVNGLNALSGQSIQNKTFAFRKISVLRTGQYSNQI
ncbi:hypothetical protein TSUD_169860 [Trifolium subterraneum]|nr:hypothetical protein TSUD_169860 [Trifolium subterraneum]